ncbi:hypothetical protein EVAR_56790_1 [Eumeta japonica]|uniref:Uncharacterized protein n=1 Tax=Eumeta variegata TaxID=151549 RepID=A0A4C1Z087_EUMVA|nr:hypothetical protein EVAR_56790_1 [Eumeta japonica]
MHTFSSESQGKKRKELHLSLQKQLKGKQYSVVGCVDAELGAWGKGDEFHDSRLSAIFKHRHELNTTNPTQHLDMKKLCAVDPILFD